MLAFELASYYKVHSQRFVCIDITKPCEVSSKKQRRTQGKPSIFFFRCRWFACYFVCCLPGLLSQSCLQVPLPTERVVWTNNRALVRLRDINGENPSSALVPFCSPEGKLFTSR